jgi:3-methylcrotonyl-CoA carboxylase alpha subunit
VLFLVWQGQQFEVRAVDPLVESSGSAAMEGGLTAPMNGSIVRILVSPGQQVQAGDALIVVEAMKMEHTLRAATAGTVTSIFCGEGELVAEGVVLAELEEAADDAA